MPFSVKNKRVIVTGGAQGIGLELARCFIGNGAKVCIADIKVNIGNEAAKNLCKEFAVGADTVCFIKCDVTSKYDWSEMWGQAENALGGKIEILCNNAGAPPSSGIDNNMNVMSVGNTQGAMYALKKMQISNGGNGGRIITTASVAGLMSLGGYGDISKGGDCIAKWGNIVMTRLFANCTPSLEADGVKSYALAPAMNHAHLKMGDFEADTWAKEKIAKIMKVLCERLGQRTMETEDISAAMMKALDVDKNGAVYVVHGNSPIIQWPAFENPIVLSFLILGRLLALFRIRYLPSWVVYLLLLLVWPVYPYLIVACLLVEKFILV